MNFNFRSVIAGYELYVEFIPIVNQYFLRLFYHSLTHVFFKGLENIKTDTGESESIECNSKLHGICLQIPAFANWDLQTNAM